MPSLQDVKYKLTAVKKTKQITRAMNMVASAKLRLSQKKMTALQPYYARYTEVIERLMVSQGTIQHKLCIQHKQQQIACIVVFAPDRGLCGAFAGMLLSLLQETIASYEKQYKKILLYPVGKKAYEFCSRFSHPIIPQNPLAMAQVDFTTIASITTQLQELFLKEEVDVVSVVQGLYKSLLSQKASITQIFPLVLPEHKEQQRLTVEPLMEPSSAVLLGTALPAYAQIVLYNAFLHTLVSEHAARMLAMDNATENCNDLINSLELLYNKTRQATVTRELMDIVGGAEALSG